MAITLVATAKTPTSFPGSTNNTSTCTIAKPTGTASGDVMLAFIQAGEVTVSPPVGWTLVSQRNHATGTANFQNYVYWRAAGGSEGSSYQWTDDGSNGAPLQGAIATFRGVDTTNPIDVQASAETGGTDTVDTPNATSVAANVVMIHYRTAKTSEVGSQGSFAVNASWDLVFSVGNRGGSTQYFSELYAPNGYPTVSPGVQNGIQFNMLNTYSAGATASIERQIGLKMAGVPATGTLTSSVPAITSAFAATRVMPEGPLSSQLASIVGSFAGTAAPPEGSVSTVLPSISADFEGGQYHGPISSTLASITSAWAGAVNPIGSFSGQLGAVTSEFTAESRKFGEHVINVEADHRAFLVTDEDTGLIAIKRSQVTTL